MRVADDEGDRHGLAERAAEAEHDAADDADAGIGQHDVAHDFRGRGADAVGRFAQHRRHRREHVAHHRGDEGQHHEAEDDAGREHAQAQRRSGEKCADDGQLAQRRDQRRLHRDLQERRQHEQAPDAVDDAGDGGQQLDQRADRPAQHRRAQLGEKDGDPEGERNADEHGDERGDQRAVDRRPPAEILLDRVPGVAGQEAPAECAERRQRPRGECRDDGAQQHQHADGEDLGGAAERRVLKALPIDPPSDGYA